MGRLVLSATQETGEGTTSRIIWPMSCAGVVLLAPALCPSMWQVFVHQQGTPLPGEPTYGRGEAFPGARGRGPQVVNYRLPAGATLPGVDTGSTMAVAVLDGNGPPLAWDARQGYVGGDQRGFWDLLGGDGLAQRSLAPLLPR